MAQDYTKEDLKNNKKLFANRLRTRVLAEFFTDNLASKIYIYKLSNGQTIHLLFDNNQFCHLLGFSYFGYNGIAGWNSLKEKNILVSNLYDISNHKREEIRITNFSKILQVLEDPTMYFYKNIDMRYKANYFAVWNDNKRYYKLGIGTASSGINYGETFQVSLINSKDNREIDENNRLNVEDKRIIPRDSFRDSYERKHFITKK